MEDYKKKYEEAFEKAKEIYDGDTATVVTRTFLEMCFPELKESEGEKIRKALKEYFINSFQNNGVAAICGVHIKDVLAWLEKQGEQKPAELIKEYDFYGVKFVPKFKKGDLIREKLSGRILTIKDFSYDNGLYDYDAGQFPITIQDNYEVIEQKPAWSEGDEIMHNDCICAINAANEYDYTAEQKEELVNWLKSLKERVQSNPIWSEKDRRMLIGLIDELDAIMNKATPNEISVYSKYINWLKSLARYTWKPSDEQMRILNEVLNFAANHKSSHWNDYIFRTLDNLIRQIKKLREDKS